MRVLILIRHSISQPDANVPASEWRLTAEGRELCRPLAAALAPWRPDRLISSMEPKAIETAQRTAAKLGVPAVIAAGLHEHDRSNVPYLASKEEFIEQVRLTFRNPDEVVFGLESAAQSLHRFGRAVERLLESHAGENIAVVTHGMVMSLYAGDVLGKDPQDIWASLGMPAYLVLSFPEMKMLELVTSISPDDQRL